MNISGRLGGPDDQASRDHYQTMFSLDRKLDTALFTERELREIREDIEHFLTYEKQRGRAPVRHPLIARSVKRGRLLPLGVALVCLGLWMVGGIFYVTDAVWGTHLISDIFVPHGPHDNLGEIISATHDFIADIRDKQVVDLVDLYVNLINMENVEAQLSRNMERVSDPVDLRLYRDLHREVGVLKGEFEREVANIVVRGDPRLVVGQAGVEEGEARADGQARADGVRADGVRAVRPVPIDYQTVGRVGYRDIGRIDYQTLARQSERASLQRDQYRPLVEAIGDALEDDNLNQTAALLRQLDALLANPVMQSDPLLSNLTHTGSVFSNGVRRYVAIARNVGGDRAGDGGDLEVGEAGEAGAREVSAAEAEAAGLGAAGLVEVAFEAEGGLRRDLVLERGAAMLMQEIERLNAENKRLGDEANRLRLQMNELFSEIDRIRTAQR